MVAKGQRVVCTLLVYRLFFPSFLRALFPSVLCGLLSLQANPLIRGRRRCKHHVVTPCTSMVFVSPSGVLNPHQKLPRGLRRYAGAPSLSVSLLFVLLELVAEPHITFRSCNPLTVAFLRPVTFAWALSRALTGAADSPLLLPFYVPAALPFFCRVSCPRRLGRPRRVYLAARDPSDWQLWGMGRKKCRRFCYETSTLSTSCLCKMYVFLRLRRRDRLNRILRAVFRCRWLIVFCTCGLLGLA